MKYFILIIGIALTLHSATKANDLPPLASFTDDVNRGFFFAGETVTFDGSGSIDQDEGGSNITRYRWKVDGVTMQDSTTAYFSTVFSLTSGQNSKTVQVILEVQDDEGTWNTHEGKMTKTYTLRRGQDRHFFVKDHLGSIRVTVDEAGEPISFDDYYPYGLQMPTRSGNISNPNDKYKFTAYEFDDEGGLKLYYAGARMYDPILGRFMSVDRFYDKYPSMSPYQYAANNPINFIDINGDSVYQITTDVARGVGGNHHTYLLLAPDDLEAFSKSGYADLLQEYTFTNEQGVKVTKQGIIVRAGPETNNIFDLGSLSAATNEQDHPLEGQTSIYLINPGDQSDNEFITNILGNHSNYIDRQDTPGLVPEYSLPPFGEAFTGGKERYTNLSGYNSNSYINGLIQASGGRSVNPFPKTPLNSNPVPSHYYLPFKVKYK